jgi:hypothetical protein
MRQLSCLFRRAWRADRFSLSLLIVTKKSLRIASNGKITLHESFVNRNRKQPTFAKLCSCGELVKFLYYQWINEHNKDWRHLTLNFPPREMHLNGRTPS